MKIHLSGGEPSLPPAQSDEVVILDSQLSEADEVVAIVNKAITQNSNRRKRGSLDNPPHGKVKNPNKENDKAHNSGPPNYLPQNNPKKNPN